jgi:hypothetical protein
MVQTVGNTRSVVLGTGNAVTVLESKTQWRNQARMSLSAGGAEREAECGERATLCQRGVGGYSEGRGERRGSSTASGGVESALKVLGFRHAGVGQLRRDSDGSVGERESRGRCEGPPILAGRVQGPPSTRRGLSAKHDDGQGEQRGGPIIAPATRPSFAAAPGLTRAGGLACMNRNTARASRAAARLQQCNASGAARTPGGAAASHATPPWFSAQSPQRIDPSAASPPYVSRADRYLRVRSKLF